MFSMGEKTRKASSSRKKFDGAGTDRLYPSMDTSAFPFFFLFSALFFLKRKKGKRKGREREWEWEWEWEGRRGEGKEREGRGGKKKENILKILISNYTNSTR